ncbi:hypothetical protein TorRG33x02_343660, partial [Trema orientale]
MPRHRSTIATASSIKTPKLSRDPSFGINVFSMLETNKMAARASRSLNPSFG